MNQRINARQRGFTLIEMSLVIVVIGMLSTLVVRFYTAYNTHQRGVQIGQTMAEVQNAVEDFGSKHRSEIINNATGTPTPITGVATPLQPTLAELSALGHLSKLIDPKVARAGNIQVRYSVTPAGCTPLDCGIQYLSYIDGPVLEGSSNRVATATLDSATLAAGARAGGSEAFAPTRLRGLKGQWDAPNPVAGNPVGIFAMLSSSSDSGTDRYVRMQDVRDPDLKGNLTVAKDLAISQNAAVTGTLNVQQATTLAGLTTVNNNAAITGKLDVGGNVVATGSVQGDRLIPKGSYVRGSACPEDGAMAKSAGAMGSVVCWGGSWRALMTFASAGDACPVNGSDATDASDAKLICINGVYRPVSNFLVQATAGTVCATSGQPAWDFTGATPTQLFCKANRSSGILKWFRVQDITTNLVFVDAYEVANGGTINKPNCGAAGGQVVAPILQLIPKTETSTDVGFTRYAVDNGATWSVVLTDSSGTGLGVAIGQVYCYYD